jgi:hypothetical protein
MEGRRGRREGAALIPVMVRKKETKRAVCIFADDKMTFTE